MSDKGRLPRVDEGPAYHGRRRSSARWRSSKFAFVSRLLLGGILLGGGLANLLLGSSDPNPTPEGERVLTLLRQTGYLLEAVAITEIATGLLLLSGYFLPLALVLAAPLIVNFFLFHLFVQLAGAEGVFLIGALYLHLVFVHRHHYSDILLP